MESTRDFKYKGGRNGTYSLSTTANPYYVFPLMYNFRYNVYSSSLHVANRLIEVFIQDNRNTNDSWLRVTNGMTDDEKALLLLQKYNFNELLSELTAPVVAEAMIAHYKGDEKPNPSVEAIIRMLKSLNVKTDMEYLHSLYLDLPPKDNRVILELPAD